MSENKEKKSLKRTFEDIYIDKREDLLDEIETSRNIKDAGFIRRELIKELEELILEYHGLIKEKL